MNQRSWFLFMLVFSSLGGCATVSSDEQYSVSDHFDGQRFFNPWGVNNTKSFWDVMKWKLGSSPAKWPKSPIKNTTVPQLIQSGGSGSLHVTYIGHATIYLQGAGIAGRRNILTDPYFSDRASPVSFAGPMRARPPALKMNELPGVDVVVVSHNHYDHLDIPSLKELHAKFKPEFIVPLGNARLLRAEGIDRITELDWWQSHQGVQLVPAQHWSARGMGDRNEALWGGYVIELPSGDRVQKVFFAGDTGYGPHFKMIRERCGPMDLSLLPIGAYEPRWFMKDQHMNPEEAVQAHQDLESRQSLAIHFETIQMTDEPFEEPRSLLSRALVVRSLSKDVVLAPEVGQTLILK